MFKKMGGKLGKKLAKHAISALISMISSLLAFLAPILLPVMIGLGVLLGITALINIDFSFRSEEYLYTDFDATGKITDGTDVSLSSSLENELSALFYLKYSQNGYYFTVGDDNTLIQNGVDPYLVDGVEVKDVHGREDMFILNPTTLMVLDEELNPEIKFVNQLVKPVYNTCSTGSESAKCTLKELTDENGDLVVESQKYELNTGEVPAEIDTGWDMGFYSPVEGETVKSVSDWGFAPIFHYEKYSQKERVTDYRIDKVQILRIVNGEPVLDAGGYRIYDTLSVDSLTAEQLEEYKTIFNFDQYKGVELTYEGNKDEWQKSSRGLNAPEDKYAIDHIASMWGDIDYPFTADYTTKGAFDVQDVGNEKVYRYKTIESDIENPKYLKSYENYSGHKLVWKDVDRLTDAEKKSCDDTKQAKKDRYDACKLENGSDKEADQLCNGLYNDYSNHNVEVCYKDNMSPAKLTFITLGGIINSTNDLIVGDENWTDAQIQAEKDKIYSNMFSTWTEKLPYLKSGVLEIIEPIYSNNLSFEGITGSKYLTDYADNYEAYKPVTSGHPYVEEYECRLPNPGTYIEGVSNDPNYQGPIQEYIDAAKDEDLVSYEDIMANTTVQSVTHDPSRCPADTIAMSINTSTLSKLNFGDYPSLQYVLIAKNFGYAIKENAMGVIQMESLPVPYILTKGIGNQSDAFDKVMSTKIGGQNLMDMINSAASTYGVDANLLVAIIAEQTGGEVEEHLPVYDECWKQVSGCGITGFQIGAGHMTGTDPTIFTTYSAYNFSTKKMEKAGFDRYQNNFAINPLTKVISASSISNVQELLNVTALYLADILQTTNNNIPMTIHYYEVGSANMGLMYDVYKKRTGISERKAKGDTDKLDWLIAVDAVVGNDKEYLGKILSMFTYNNSAITFKTRGALNISDVFVTYKFYHLRDTYVNGSEGVDMVQRIVSNKMKSMGDEGLRNIWSLVFANRLEYDDSVYEVEDGVVKASPYNTYLKAPYTANGETIAGKIFARGNGGHLFEYFELSESELRIAIAGLFQTGASQSWNFNIDLDKLFPNGFEITTPTKTFIPNNDIGYYTDPFGNRKYKPYIEVSSTGGEVINSIAKGKVIDAGKNSEALGNYVVVSYANDKNEGSIMSFYHVGEIYVSIGDEVLPGTKLAKVDSSGLYRLELETPDGIESFKGISEVIQRIKDEQAALYAYSYAPGKQNAEVLKKLKEMLAKGEFDNWESSTTLENTIVENIASSGLTYGSWTYTTNAGSSSHNGMDIGVDGNTNTGLFVPAKAVIVHYNDEHRDNTSDSMASYSTNNKLGFMFDLNGTIYHVNISHMKQNSVTAEARNLIVDAGTRIATVGNSGMSFGYHGHIEVIRLGEMTMKEAISMYSEPNWYNTVGSNRCDSAGGSGACRERPECLFAYDDRTNVPSYAQKVWQNSYKRGSNYGMTRSCKSYPFSESYRKIL